MKTKRLLSCSGIAVCIAAGMGVFADNAGATAIIGGQANFDGSVTVSDTTIDFFNNASVANVYNVNTGFGSFAGLSTPDSILNLTMGPITGPTSVVGFLTATTSIGVIKFDITNIDPGTGTLAACSSDSPGSTCTPAGSPFTLTQASADTVGFTFSAEGIAYTGQSSTGSTPAQILLTGQQVPGTITEVLVSLENNGTFSNTFSGAISVGAPEPGTLAEILIGCCFVGLGSLRRRRAAAVPTP
jgi:hypothetical protein